MGPVFCWIGSHAISMLGLLVVFSLVSPFTYATNYKAAVYEYTVIPCPKGNVNRAGAVANMMKNVDVFREKSENAAKQGAKMIVFPEYGILGFNLNRITVKPYLEELPDPKCVEWNPCEQPHEGTEIQRELSCIAKQNDIYLVANMGTKRHCTTKDDPSCPSDGQYQFNTNVVYSNTGMLVAVYHKRHLFNDFAFDPAPETEYVFFDTPFGRFGTVICFDLIFKEPTHVLLEKYKVDNLIFPTAWVDFPPFYRSIMVHSAFARGYSINVLTANLHSHFSGSGLYSPGGQRAYFYDITPGLSKLLVNDMETISEKIPLPQYTKISQVASDVGTIVTGSVLGLEFSFKILSQPEDNVVHCNGDFCCRVIYEMIGKKMTDTYALGVANGFMHLQGEKLYTKTCTLSKCSGNNCVAVITGSETTFQKFKLEGQFKSKYLLPRVIAMDGSSYVFVDNEWTYHQGGIYVDKAMSLPLHSAVLEERDYDRDQLKPGSDIEPDLPKCKRDNIYLSGGSNRLNSDILTVISLLLCVLVQWKN